MSEYDFWLLDLDGTLVDVEFAYSRSVFDRVGERLDYRFTDTEIDILWNGLSGQRNAQLMEWGIDPERFWQIFHEEEDPRARAEATYLHDDAEAVADLEGPMGLVTHCQAHLTDPVLDHVGIRDWFDSILCCTPEIGWKPDPAPVEHVVAELGVEGQQGLLVGDGPSDVGAAWNAGLDAAHIERFGPEHRGQCVLGDYRVTGFDELIGA
ncbi:MAG: HAD family hydrolase [Natrialbaceae archaeon]|nr:HAD family hydrolase [Natrialbaceae archaeon]